LLLLSFSDVRVALGNYDDALRRAERAVALSERLLKRYPDNKNLKRHIYAGSFRIGDEKARTSNNQEAEQQYNKALDMARQLGADDPANMDRQRDAAFILNKLGDLYKIKKDWKTAMDQYNAGLKIAAAVAEKYPGDLATQKNRIAQLLSEKNEPGDAQAALAQYREALAIQTDLLGKSPDNATLLSNAALTRRRIGGLLKASPQEARSEYEAAVVNRKKLFESDPGSVPWRTGLATDYMLLGDTLLQLKDFRGAAQNYNAASQIQAGLVLKDPTNVGWQRDFAITSRKRGDLLVIRGNEALVNPEPIIDESSRLINDALTRYRTAAEGFEKIAGDPKAGSARFSNLFDVRIKIGDILVRQGKYKEALEIYQSAAATAEQAAPIQRVVEWQVKLSSALDQTGDLLAYRAGGTPEAPALASKDEPDASAYYQKAIEAVEAAAVKDPDNQDLKSRKAAIVAKVESQRPPAR
jgi:tetratricopeptide (TPR) repeat protein